MTEQEQQTHEPATLEMRRGRKTIYGLECTPGIVTVRLDCDECPIGCVAFTVSAAAAAELFSDRRSRNVQDIVPELAKELREVFISGMTPAEFDVMCGRDPLNTIETSGFYEMDCPHCEQKTTKLLKRGEGEEHGCPNCTPVPPPVPPVRRRPGT